MDQDIQKLREEVAALLALVKQQEAELATLKVAVLAISQEGNKRQ